LAAADGDEQARAQQGSQVRMHASEAITATKR
jgi:hypothetical protein